MPKRYADRPSFSPPRFSRSPRALAQDGADKSAFVRFLEGLLSTSERQVSLTGVEGVFSSAPRVERITISDAGGPWLEIEGVEVAWNRSALLSRTLDIDSLSARRVALLRMPAPSEPSQSESGFRGPPVNIDIASFAFPDVTLAPAVAGAEAQMTAAGSARVTAEALAAQLSVDRQDRAGTLTADLRLEPQANVLTADLRLEEPAGGLLAEMLDLRGRPAVAIALTGTGPLDAWRATLSMDAGGARVLAGDASITRGAAGLQRRRRRDRRAGNGGAAGLCGACLPAKAGWRSMRRAAPTARSPCSPRRLRSDGVDLAVSGRLTADLVPESAELSLRLGDAGRAALPFAPGDMSVATLQVNAGLDAGADRAMDACDCGGGRRKPARSRRRVQRQRARAGVAIGLARQPPHHVPHGRRRRGRRAGRPGAARTPSARTCN